MFAVVLAAALCAQVSLSPADHQITWVGVASGTATLKYYAPGSTTPWGTSNTWATDPIDFGMPGCHFSRWVVENGNCLKLLSFISGNQPAVVTTSASCGGSDSFEWGAITINAYCFARLEMSSILVK
jgi:hypothetical protein